MDQLTAYEPNPDMLHYTTKFIDGLKPDIRLIVVVQRPIDLDTAYSIVVVQEEIGDDEVDYYHSSARRPQSSSSYRHTKPPSTRIVEESRAPEVVKTVVETDKLATLKAYRRAKGLCFICGERLGKDHKCNTTVQLHVVQEMLEFCSPDLAESEDCEEDLMVLSAETQTTDSNTSVIRLSGELAGHSVSFLLDSGNSHSFPSSRLAQIIPNKVPLPRQQRVRIAGGGHFLCTHLIQQCPWSVAGHTFQSDFKILPLQHYDGIIEMDWLSARGTMQVNWNHKWLSFDHQGATVFLQGEPPVQFDCTVVELQLIQSTIAQPEKLPDDLQRLLDQFPEVFSLPTALPPRRACDHKIPLIEGARPVKI
uniref:Uncharacterized protein n=1 Tax=Avena sativa TaxID=4498 RepID=A0ACD5Y6A6_AVESA